MKAQEALGLDWVITLKDNQPDLLPEAQRLLPCKLPIRPFSANPTIYNSGAPRRWIGG